jgi:iron-sulfur cluster assembly accessory protein
MHMNLITVTENAATQLRSKMASQSPAPEAVFVSVKTTGCSGMSYDLQFLQKLADAPKFADRIDAHGITVIIDPKASMYLVGSVMDYRKDALHSGFDFANPNETARCGCGESFTVAPAKG